MKSLLPLLPALLLVGWAAPARADEPPPTSRFFDAYDLDADGKVTSDEFKGDAETFRLLDKNADGVITLDELGLPADYKPRPKPPQAPGGGPGKGKPGRGKGAGAERLKKMDKDGDGRITKEEFTGPAEMFARLDRNGDGCLDQADFAPDARPPGDGKPPEGGMPPPGGGFDPEAIKARWKAMDKDGDGKVSREEYTGKMPFEKIDGDGDGFLTDADLARLPKPPGEPGQPGQPGAGPGRAGPGRPGPGAEVLRRFDKDKDGRVSRDEFPGSDERFTEMDKDGDGCLTEKDFPAPAAPGGGGGAGGPGGPPPGGGLFGALDRDHNGKLSREEFGGSDEEWRRLDKNADGWVTPDEAGAGSPPPR
jgi:Ca2+-binding EF-hand superfamily protein